MMPLATIDSSRSLAPGHLAYVELLYAYYPSRRQAPAKLRAFLDFIQLIAADA
jgi:DNA-binding transcriptional LysR family regulator